MFEVTDGLINLIITNTHLYQNITLHRIRVKMWVTNPIPSLLGWLCPPTEVCPKLTLRNKTVIFQCGVKEAFLKALGGCHHSRGHQQRLATVD